MDTVGVSEAWYVPVYILLGAFSLDTLNCMLLDVRENTHCIRELARGSVCCNTAFGNRVRDKSRERKTVPLMKDIPCISC